MLLGQMMKNQVLINGSSSQQSWFYAFRIGLLYAQKRKDYGNTYFVINPVNILVVLYKNDTHDMQYFIILLEKNNKYIIPP